MKYAPWLVLLGLALPAQAQQTLQLDFELQWGSSDDWSSTAATEAVDELLRLAEDETLEVRLAAVEVLGEISGERAIAALSNILWENQKDVRLRAAEILGAKATPEALAAIALAARSERDNDVRRVLRRTLRERVPIEELELPTEDAVTTIISPST